MVCLNGTVVISDYQGSALNLYNYRTLHCKSMLSVWTF